MSKTTKKRTHSKPITEAKQIDLPAADYLITADSGTNTNIYLINTMQLGNAFYQRIGNRVNLRNMNIVGRINFRGAAVSGNDQIRWAIVWDRAPSKTGADYVLPLYSDIFQDVDSVGTATSTVYSGVNINNKNRFKILRNKCFMAPATALTLLTTPDQIFDFEENCVNIDEFVDLKQLQTVYRSTANPITITNITSGALYLVTQGAHAPTLQPYELRVKFRLRYDD